jgi:hypothetical protein
MQVGCGTPQVDTIGAGWMQVGCSAPHWDTTGAGWMQVGCGARQLDMTTEHVFPPSLPPSPSCCRDDSGAAQPGAGAAWVACTAGGRRRGAPPARTVSRQPNSRTRASL